MMDAPALALVYALHLMPRSEPADLQCLTEAIYYEAKTQTVQGQLAVAQVVLNRRKSPAFPQSVCAVVYQKQGARCQFSWACNAKTLRQTKDPLQWATFFHAAYVKPYWPHLQKTARIGGHIFYKPRRQA